MLSSGAHCKVHTIGGLGVQSVDFTKVDIDDFHLAMLSPLTGTIKEFNFHGCAHITDRGINFLRGIHTLDMSW